jgi:hypothetical protein
LSSPGSGCCPAKDTYTNVLLTDLVRLILQGHLADVKEEFRQKLRPREYLACGDPLSQLPARVIGGCHADTRFKSNHPSKESDCISCHMPKKEAVELLIALYEKNGKPEKAAALRHKIEGLIH